MKSFFKKHGVSLGGVIVGVGIGIGICTITGYPRFGKLKLLPKV
jgi:hypothetical protein